MTNKLTSVGIALTRSFLMGNPTLTRYGYGYRESPTFLIGYGNRYGDVHIPAIILVSI